MLVNYYHVFQFNSFGGYQNMLVNGERIYFKERVLLLGILLGYFLFLGQWLYTLMEYFM